MSNKRYATRDFQDAGTERQFKAGAELTEENTGGHLANYEAAGLASDKRPDNAAPATEKVTTGTTDKGGDKPA